MKKLLLVLILICTKESLRAQSPQGPLIYEIFGDSVKITNDCDTAELIIENHTQNVSGFLFNKGQGRTEFRRGLQKITDNVFLIGTDSLKLSNFWQQGGNSYNATGVLGTSDNNHLDFYTNATARGRVTAGGNWIIGSTIDEGDRFRVVGNGAVSINPTLSRPGDRIRIGGGINTGDGQNLLLSVSSNGVLYRPVIMERDGFIGFSSPGYSSTYGYPLSILNGVVAFGTQNLYFGPSGGPYNNSALVTGVSNLNEWHTGVGNYPNGQNYYSFRTVLLTPEGDNKRAPLKIGARELDFETGAGNALAVKIAESRNVLIGTETDNGNKFQVNGSSFLNGPLTITGTMTLPNVGAHTIYAPTITSSGANGSYLFGARIFPTINFSSNNQQAYGVSIEPIFNPNGYQQHTEGISAALRVKSTMGGIWIEQASSTGGLSGQPIYINQIGSTNKEFIKNLRNSNELSTLPFIYNSDNRPPGNRTAVVPALRSTVISPETGGGVSFTMDRFYWGTEASVEMKYETTPNQDIGSTINTAIAFNTRTNGALVTPLYLSGNKAGIGTNTPSAQLQVNGTVRFNALTSDNNLTRFLVSDVNGNLYYREVSSLAVDDLLRSSLAVSGPISAHKITITKPGIWPDYVFTTGYKLPSLNDVEKYIQQNNHLPGVPSAAEVEKKGIDVGENQAALLKKIEELTLYIIQQQKQINTQNEAMLSLKEEVNELKALIKNR